MKVTRKQLQHYLKKLLNEAISINSSITPDTAFIDFSTTPLNKSMTKETINIAETKYKTKNPNADPPGINDLVNLVIKPEILNNAANAAQLRSSLTRLASEITTSKKQLDLTKSSEGYSLDKKRLPIKENDIPDILDRYHNLADESNRTRKDKSFLVPFDEIKANYWDLSINRYKEIVYEEIEYADPSEIIKDIETLDKERNDALTALKEMLG